MKLVLVHLVMLTLVVVLLLLLLLLLLFKLGRVLVKVGHLKGFGNFLVRHDFTLLHNCYVFG